MTFRLNRRQTCLYTLRADFYQDDISTFVPSGNGRIQDPIKSSTPIYTGVPCYRETTVDSTELGEAGRNTQDNLFTADKLHTPMFFLDELLTLHPLEVGGNWRVVLTDTLNPVGNQDSGSTFVTLGQAMVKSWKANKQVFLIRYDLSQEHL